MIALDRESEARLLTVPEAAEWLGVAESTVWRWLREGRLGSVKVGGRRRVPVAAVHAILGGNQQTGDASVAGETPAPYEAATTADRRLKFKKLFEDIRELQRSIAEWLASRPELENPPAEELVREVREENTP